MQEIEIKILNIDEKEIIQKLYNFGAEFVGEFHIHDKQFDFLNKKIQKANELLRLRLIDDQAELTYKCEKKFEDGFRISKEIETFVDNSEYIENILQRLGLEKYCDRKKRRISFKKGNVKFEIDKFLTIPAYLEIEGNKNDIINALDVLGYSMNDVTNMTTVDVLSYYGVNPFLQR